jgi:hypothetical protein
VEIPVACHAPARPVHEWHGSRLRWLAARRLLDGESGRALLLLPKSRGALLRPSHPLVVLDLIRRNPGGWGRGSVGAGELSPLWLSGEPSLGVCRRDPCRDRGKRHGVQRVPVDQEHVPCGEGCPGDAADASL